MNQRMIIDMEKKPMTRVWTSLSEKDIAQIETFMLRENRTFSAMVRELILDGLLHRD